MSEAAPQKNIFAMLMASSKPLQGGWSRNTDLSGNRAGYQSESSGISQQDKHGLVGEFIGVDDNEVVNAAVDHSYQSFTESRDKREDPQLTSGHLNEAFETARLAANHDIVNFQQPVRSAVTGNYRKPDLTVRDGDSVRFVDIKTSRIHDPQQMTDIFNSNTNNTGLDVNFSASSRSIDSDSLDHLDALSQQGSAVDGRRTLRVRSNSMSEGAFISPSEMKTRIERRANTHKKVGQ